MDTDALKTFLKENNGYYTIAGATEKGFSREEAAGYIVDTPHG